MNDWLVGIFGEAYATAAFWTIILLAIAIVLLVFLRANRRFTSGTFISGGRSKKPRLAVTDATPVDNQRRLVLVRRDNVEHLILIGGPSDIVIENNIATQSENLEEPVSAPEPRSILGNEQSDASQDTLSDDLDTRLDDVTEQSSEPASAPETPQTEQRPAPAISAVQPAARPAASFTSAPQRYQPDARKDPVRPTPEPANAPASAPPARSPHGAASSVHSVSSLAPAEPNRVSRHDEVREEPTNASVIEPRQKPMAPRKPVEQVATVNAPQSREQDLEHTLEDEVSRLLEELSEQKH